jgi:hypothetical protein
LEIGDARSIQKVFYLKVCKSWRIYGIQQGLTWSFGGLGMCEKSSTFAVQNKKNVKLKTKEL